MQNNAISIGQLFRNLDINYNEYLTFDKFYDGN